MKHRDRARRCGDGAEGLQVVLASSPASRRWPGSARHSGARSTCRPPHRQPRIVPLRRAARDLDQDPGATVLREVQAERAPAGEGAAEVDEVAVAVRPRADHGIREHDGVRIPPRRSARRNAAGRWSGTGAGEGRDAAEFLVRLHQTATGCPHLRATPEELGMDQVDGADVERRRHPNASAEPTRCSTKSRLTCP